LTHDSYACGQRRAALDVQVTMSRSRCPGQALQFIALLRAWTVQRRRESSDTSG